MAATASKLELLAGCVTADPLFKARPQCVQKRSGPEEDGHRGGLWPAPIASLPKLLGVMGSPVNGERKGTHLMGWPPEMDEIIP